MKYIEYDLMEIYKSSEITVHKLSELREEDKDIQIPDVNCYLIL